MNTNLKPLLDERTNAWGVTHQEYKTALNRAYNDGAIPRHDNEAYWQLVRFYRGEIFNRDLAARAVRLIRGTEENVT